MEFNYSTEFSDSLVQEWRSLFDTGLTKVPFLRPEYLQIWWQTRGGGEWPDSAQLVLITAREAGKLVGLAPCFVAERDGKRSLLLLGAIEVSDYLDLVVSADRVDAFARGFVEYVKTHLATELKINQISLDNILEQSPSIQALQQASLELGLQSEINPLERAPYITLNGNYEDYLARLDKKQRHEIRRKMRRLQELPTPTRWYIASDPAKLDEEIDEFLRLMAYDPQKVAFLTDKMKDQMRLSMKDAFTAGYLQLVFLCIGEARVAAYLNFDFGNNIYVYNSGMNPEYFEHSPGWVLLGYLLQWANENQRSEFDFMRGTEDYKYKFGGVDRQVMRVSIQL
ncbi:MAG: GNAT family N-acetyltransferase [Anaerolineaceae bacterium]|nr:GNAT family N-acetyltransferase [Anaerolineaceae bacterium]